MSDASQFSNSITSRPLRQEEQDLIHSLLSEVFDEAELDKTLSASRVIDMQDGGMGSIRFVRPERRTFGRALVEAQYTDVDGVPVSIALNVDQLGQLFEMDFWKADFSPLKQYPKPANLTVTH